MSLNKKKPKHTEDDDDAFNETFVIYGTELPDTDEQDKGKFQPVWKQEVSILLPYFMSKLILTFFLFSKGS
jgi:hypothetical protein